MTDRQGEREREFVDKNHEVTVEYYDLCGKYSKRNSKVAEEQLKQLIEKDPDFFDTYLLLYEKLNSQKRYKEAEKLLDEAYSRATKLIIDKDGNWPERLEWGWLENRHIIRTILNMALILWDRGESGRSLLILRKLLRMNHNDNVGARDYILAIRMDISFKEFEKRFNKGGYYDDTLLDWFDKNYKKFPDEFGWWEKAVESGCTDPKALRKEIDTPEELISKFVNSGLMVDTDIVREIVKRDDVHNHLYNIMKDDLYWETGKAGDAWSPYHVFHILGLKKDEKSFETLQYAITHRVDELGDWITEDLPGILYSFGTKYLKKITAIVLDKSKEMYVRLAALSALCAFAVDKPRLIKNISQLCMQLLNEEDDEFLGLSLPQMAEVKDEDLFEKIKDYHTGSNFAKDIATFEDLTELHEFRSKMPEYSRLKESLWQYFSEDNLGRRYKRHYKSDDGIKLKKTISSEAKSPKFTEKIGRNDPCPCGSGKKYKKCCLNKEQ